MTTELAHTKHGPSRKRRLRGLTASSMAAVALVAAGSSPAAAQTFHDSNSGKDHERSTVLNYKKPHGNFNLRVYVKKHALVPSDKYSIKFRDKSNRVVWSAANQRDRTYKVGGNVTKIEVVRNSAVGADTYWKRK